MVAEVAVAELVAGLVLGALLGFLLGPVVRFWLAWREWTEASREARLTDAVLERMEAGPWRALRDRQPAQSSRPDTTGGAS